MARANAPLRRIRLCTTEQSLTQPTCRRGGPYVFARHAPAHEEAVKSGDGDDQADLRQACAQFLKRDILACLPDGKDVCRTLFHPARAHIATLWLRGKVASLAPLCLPADRRRWSNAKTSSCSTAAQPVINRRQKSRTQIHRKGVSHPCRPPSPARILNQKSHPAGIPPPPQFKTVENRSNLHYSSDHRQKFYNHLSDQYGYFSILPISPTESEAT